MDKNIFNIDPEMGKSGVIIAIVGCDEMSNKDRSSLIDEISKAVIKNKNEKKKTEELADDLNDLKILSSIDLFEIKDEEDLSEMKKFLRSKYGNKKGGRYY
jgi:hypothetical protein